MDLNPSQFRLLLAGAKVSRLLPFVTSRGYVAEGCLMGSEAVELMRREPRHVLLVELELDDLLLADLLQIVRRENLAGAVILLDDPAKSGMIISQLIRGVDGYVATPPDELYLFRVIERQLLAQWAIAQMGRATQDAEEKQRLEKAVQVERAKVMQLVKDLAALREEVIADRATAIASAAASKWSAKLADEDDPDTLSPEDLADDFANTDDPEDAVTLRAARAVARNVRSDVNMPELDDRTSPAGWQPPPELRAAARDARPGLGAQPPAVAKAKPKPIDDDDNDLFLELDDPTSTSTETETTQPMAKAAAKVPPKKARS